ncbi:MAG: SHOCT domain-containing protein [Desulfuromonadales bacterium]|nr:SHOCT domain-containing protein [Desulfuromonadales bacterium]
MKLLNKSVCWITLICFFGLVGGCAGTKALSEKDCGELTSISIASEDVIPSTKSDFIWINSSASAWAGLLGGLAGSLAYEKFHDKTPRESIMFLFEKDKMFQKTVAEAFKYQFENANLFEITEKEHAKAHLIIEVPSIQFHQISGDNLRLTGQFFAKLVSSTDGKVLWKGHEYFSAFNSNLVRYPLNEYITDPKKLKYGVSIISQLNSAEFVKKLKGTPSSLNHDLYLTENTNIAKQTSLNSKPSSSSNNDPIKAKLLKLKEMNEAGLITEEEHSKKRADILESLTK